MRQRFLGLLAIGLLVLGSSYSLAQGQRAPEVVTMLPEEEGEIAAYDPEAEPMPTMQPRNSRVAGVHSPPEGELYPDDVMERAREVAAWDPGVVVGQTLGEQPQLRASVKIRNSRDGLNMGTSTTPAPNGASWFQKPPDTMIAASTDKILHATNGGLMMIDRATDVVATTDPNTFFKAKVSNTDGSLILFDPKVGYEPRSGRLLIVYLLKTDSPKKSRFYIAVSRSSAPDGFARSSWCTYKMNGKASGSWADYEGLGFNKDFIVITGNNFTFGASPSYKDGYIWVVDRAITDNAGSCPKLSFSRFKAAKDSLGFSAFTIQPAAHMDNSGPGGLFMLSTQSLTIPTDQYLLWRVQAGSARGPKATITMTQLTASSSYSQPPNAAQKGTSKLLESGDVRVTQTVFRDGVLYGVHALTCAQGGLPNEACLRTLEIEPTGNLSASTISRETTFGAGNKKHVFWGGIAVNANGKMLVPFQISGKNLFLGTSYTDKATGAATFSKIAVLKKGTFAAECGTLRLRTGDYVGAQSDPANDAGFVMAGEWADKKVNPIPDFPTIADCRWNTRIAEAR